MSFVGKRDALVAALNTAGVVSAYKYKPSNAKPGHAWIRRGDSERLNFLTFNEEVFIVVKLPPTEGKADEWRDANEPLLQVALENSGVAIVERFVPINLNPDPAKVEFGLQINLRSE